MRLLGRTEAAPPLEELFRPELDEIAVSVLSPDKRSISPASQALTDDVNADFRRKREEILDKFGIGTPDFLEPDHAAAISQYFRGLDRGTGSLTLIDPRQDAPEVGRILLSGFADPISAPLFSGAGDAEPTPGVISTLDTVILHDSSDMYRKYARAVVEKTPEVSVCDDEIDRVVALHNTDFVAHELGHTVEHALEGIIITQSPEAPAGYEMSELAPEHFQKYGRRVLSTTDHLPIREGDYYNCAALSEGVAARHSANIIRRLQKMKKANKLGPEDDFSIFICTTKRDGSPYYCAGGVHSGETGLAMEKLRRYVPAFADLQDQYNHGEINFETFMRSSNDHVPLNILQLMNRARGSAWKELEVEVDKLAPWQHKAKRGIREKVNTFNEWTGVVQGRILPKNVNRWLARL